MYHAFVAMELTRGYVFVVEELLVGGGRVGRYSLKVGEEMPF